MQNRKRFVNTFEIKGKKWCCCRLILFFQKNSLRQLLLRLAMCFLSAKSREKLTALIARAYLCRCQGSKEKAHAGQIPDDD